MKVHYPHGTLHKWDHEQAMYLYQQGYTDQKIADAVGVVKGTIANWRSKQGLPQNTGTNQDKNYRKPQLAIDAEEARKAGMTYGAWKALQRQ